MTPHDLLVVEADRTLARLVRFCHLGVETGVSPYATLAPDMFALSDQILIAARFPLRGAFPLAGRPIPSDRTTEGGLVDVARIVESYRVTLASITPADIRTAEVDTVRVEAGDAILDLSVDALVHRFILPNMLFHAAMAYAILRGEGVPLGKGDFDGLHVYAPGFSFL
ncbi:DUF1993 family protein [Roseobacter sp. HKCCA0434]|uniref:DUF1993 family protein n=1 Tax=Roseobacter sp. HKCCA0434 TaxID=3079297 RepID=UPI0029058102|nr:DUF1993 family protein [Roseobacter sp. HKCCA0434]